jgi:hypothetical protein
MQLNYRQVFIHVEAFLPPKHSTEDSGFKQNFHDTSQQRDTRPAKKHTQGAFASQTVPGVFVKRPTLAIFERMAAERKKDG